MENSDHARIFYLDVLRIFAVFLVVLIHVNAVQMYQPGAYLMPEWPVLLYIQVFSLSAVPILFMISGALYFQQTPHVSTIAFVKKRLRRVIYPAIFWTIIYAYVWWQTHGGTRFSEFTEWMLSGKTNYHLWYLYITAGLYVLLSPIRRLRHRIPLQVFVYLLIFWLIYMVWVTVIRIMDPSFVSSPWENMLIAVGYALLGRYLFTHPLHKHSAVVLFIFGIANLFIAVVYTDILIRLMDGKMYYVYFFYSSSTTVVMAIGLFSLLQSLIKQWSIGINTRNLFHQMSILSFGVYLIHPLVIQTFLPQARSFIPTVFMGLNVFFVALMIYGVSLLSVLILSRVPFLRRAIL